MGSPFFPPELSLKSLSLFNRKLGGHYASTRTFPYWARAAQRAMADSGAVAKEAPGQHLQVT